MPQSPVFFLQMYIHHTIYDLVFKYVGTIEASEVSLIAKDYLR